VDNLLTLLAWSIHSAVELGARGASDIKDDVMDEGEQGQSLAKLVGQLRMRIAALEKELAVYGSKYGFTDTARALLARPQEG
jgi:hypothetical protein